MNPKFKFRDLIAYPFLLFSLLLEAAAISIGGAWTAFLLLKTMERIHPAKYHLNKNK